MLRIRASFSRVQPYVRAFLDAPCRALSATAPLPPINCEDGTTVQPWSAPTRAETQARLRSEQFDVVVVGGGCVGAGVAWEASTRGLRVALVERDDFASGTSGRSTKLIHGGIRYLEAAFKNLDKGMYDLVHEALEEVRLAQGTAPRPPALPCCA